MRYHDNAQPQEWTNYYGSVYRCNHPVYRVCTLYKERSKGLCVIQQRYNEKSKATYWSAIDPWLTDKIYLHDGFKEYFDSHAKRKKSKRRISYRDRAADHVGAADEAPEKRALGDRV